MSFQQPLSVKIPYITGHFEFLHLRNVLWAVSAEKTTARKPTLRLIPGKPDWFLSSERERADLLQEFSLFQDIIAFKEIRDSKETDFPFYSSSDIPSLLKIFTQRFLKKKYFSDPEEFLSLLNSQTIRNHQIVTTNGCFDILHPGHLKTLKRAKRDNSLVIVLINSDQSVKRFKGPDRPIHSEAFRGTLLAHLSNVDYVTVFNEDTPLELMRKIRPDLHVKGGSFIEERIRAEQALLSEWNGLFEAIPMHGSFSTTEIIEKYGAPSFFPI